MSAATQTAAPGRAPARRGVTVRLRGASWVAGLPALGTVTVLSAVAGAGFAAVFPGWGFVWVPVLGAVTAGAVSAAASRLRLLVGETLALSVVAMLLVGAVAVGGATPAGMLAFLRGLVTGWAQLLTSFTPVPPSPTLLALPFVIAWFGALVGGELRRLARVPGLPALGPLLALGVTLLVTVEERGLALAQGGVMVAGILLLVVQQQLQLLTVEDELTTGTTARRSLRGLVPVGLLAALVTLLAPLVGPSLPLADANERFDLRRYLVPPFDPLQVPSPLTTVKGELREDRREQVAFVVDSPQQPRRWPVAVLGAYDGVVWTVAESAASEAGRYPPLDDAVPPPPQDELDLERAGVEAEVSIEGLGGHWVPRPGWVTTLELPEDTDVRFNPVTGNLALPDRLRDGLDYTIAAVPVPEVQERPEAPLVGDGSGFANLPPGIRNLIADLVQGEEPGWDQVEAITGHFVHQGFYDVSETARPGHSFFRLGEFLADAEQLVGFEEQFAAAAGVAARELGAPVRVVVGYLIPDERWEQTRAEVLREDISAWIEVRTVEGWVAVDVTPDRSREPEIEERGRRVEDVAEPNPPPPLPPPPDVDPTEREDDEDPDVDTDLDDEEDDEVEQLILGLPPRVIAYAASGIGLPALGLLALGLLVSTVKARRRRRRREAAQPGVRVVGAWQEVLDRCQELGRLRGPVDTTREAARRLAAGSPVDEPGWLALADRVDRAAFHPSPPPEEDVEAAWRFADEVSAALLASATFRQRLRLRIDPRPILRSDPLRGEHA